MTPETRDRRALTRRHFFASSGFSIGSLGLASMLAGNRPGLLADDSVDAGNNPLHPR
ncbi:MAG TPA: sulfatase, partial [Planctomycetes bacterium]|nr:sulfatase [Planctomycetaceae bacterium]HIN95969.1 sulfatase [Planctomycetota bacterium]